MDEFVTGMAAAPEQHITDLQMYLDNASGHAAHHWDALVRIGEIVGVKPSASEEGTICSSSFIDALEARITAMEIDLEELPDIDRILTEPLAGDGMTHHGIATKAMAVCFLLADLKVEREPEKIQTQSEPLAADENGECPN